MFPSTTKKIGKTIRVNLTANNNKNDCSIDISLEHLSL